jgi:ATP-dependent Clp protease ATP-binding subunit ClpC
MNPFIWWQRFGRNLLVFLDNKFALSVNLRLIFTPMFHDTSILGRILSFIVRLIRILIGIVVIGLSAAAWAVWFIIFIPVDLILIPLLWLKNKLGAAIPTLWLKRAGGDPKKLRQMLLNLPSIKTLMRRLEIAAAEINSLTLPISIESWLNLTPNPQPQQLFLALLKLNQWRYQSGVKAIAWQEKITAWQKTPFIWDKEYIIRPIGGVDRGQMGMTTPTLDRYSRDLTREALKRTLPEIIDKEKIIEAMAGILSRRDKHNCLVIGLPGSGKTTLVKGLAQEIVRGVKAKSLSFKRLVALDAARLAAGAGDAEIATRIESIIEEIKMSGNIILFVDEIHQLAVVNQDNPETSSLFRALEPVLNEGYFQFIGATTTENYHKYIEPNEAFSRLFEIVDLPEATPESTAAMLEYEAWRLEKSAGVFITRQAIDRAVELTGLYIHDRVFPDKAVALLSEAAAVAENSADKNVTSLTVEQLVSQKTKIPVTKIGRDEAKILLNLEAKLHRRVISQDEAVKAVAAAMKRARTKLKNPKKPIAAFLFAGPTGVGKTETAKALAAEYFGNEKTMIRLDMSEYQTEGSVDRLIAVLTEAVRHQPYALLLLDEVEKAHEKIRNLFLQVLDDARMTDLTGKTADFSNTIIIATTNAKKPLEDFAPEWLNRFNALITFKSLTQTEIKQVIKLKLDQLAQTLSQQELKISFPENLSTSLAKEAFSPQWGGRQADRVIQSKVSDVIAEKILRGEIKPNTPWQFSL